MFAPKTSAPASGGLSINVGTANNSLFGGTNTQSSSAAAPGSMATSGSLFGNTATASKPGGLFGGNTQQSSNTGTSMFGSSSTPATTQSQTPSLFGGTAGATSGAGAGTTATGTTGSSLFGGLGGSSTQNQAPKPAFGGLGGSTLGGLGASQNTQQPQKPTLSLFGDKQGPQGTLGSQQQSTAQTVVPGVKVDVSNLLPTTKFESCADEIRNEIEGIDTYILNQMKLCHEVADILPSVEQQGSMIPNDVKFVQEKLHTMKIAIENDADQIDQLRKLVARDQAEGEIAWRAIDSLQLPLQYQSTGSAWWAVQDQKVPDRGSFRKNTMALPDDVERDPSTAAAVQGLPTNMVDYFSHRADELNNLLDRYTGNIKEIEDHLNGVELNLNRQYNELVISRSREGGVGTGKSTINDLAAVLGDVEAGIMGVASRLGSVSEQVQEVALGPLPLGEGRLGVY